LIKEKELIEFKLNQSKSEAIKFQEIATKFCHQVQAIQERYEQQLEQNQAELMNIKDKYRTLEYEKLQL
jgi:hypothetical protein